MGAAASLANSAFTVKKTPLGGMETTVTLSGTPTISGKTVVLTLGTAAAATDSVTVNYTKPTSGSANKLVDQFGNEVAALTISYVPDTTPPTLSSAAVNTTGTFVQLAFSENMDPSNLPPTSTVTVTAVGSAFTVSGVVGDTTEADEIRVTVSPVIRQGQTVVVAYTDPTTGNDTNALQDTAGNDAASFTTGSGTVPAVTNGSNVAAVVPFAATGLSATASGTTAVDLSWTAPADNGGRAISGYKIEWSAAGSAPWTVLVATTGSAATTYSNTGLSSGTTRHYRVSAINTVGAGAVSNTDSATTAPTPTLNRANTAPTSANSTVTTTEDTGYTFATADFPFSDADGDALSLVTITTLPGAGKGTIYRDSVAVTSSALPLEVSFTRIALLRYVPPANGNGTGFATFKFKVNDGTADSAEYTITINVTPVNDAATGRPTITGSSNEGHTLTASTSGIIDVDGLPSSFTYQWKRFAAAGTTFEANIGTNSSTYRLTSREEGKRVHVEVSFTDNGGTNEGPLVSSAFPSSGTVDGPTSDSLNVGALGAYWNDNHDQGGNALQLDSCSRVKGFLVIWDGPEGNRRADEWAAEITAPGGSRAVSQNFRETAGSAGYFELDGRMLLAGPDSISIRVRGRFGSTWGTWSPTATLHCFESISLYGGANVGSTLIVDWRRLQAGQQTITWKRTDDDGNTTDIETRTLGANDRMSSYKLTAADAGQRISATITVAGVTEDRNSPSSSHVVPPVIKLVGRASGPYVTDEDGAYEYVASTTEHQAVETGSHRAGYTLDYVQIRLSGVADSDPAVQRVSLWSSAAAADINDRTPSRQLVEFQRVLTFLTEEEEPNNTRATFNAPVGVRLNPSTTYHIRNLKVSEAAGACELTDQSALDGNGLSGWSMATRVRQGGRNYPAGSETRSCRLSLWGTEVASSAPQVTGIRVSSRATGGVYRTGDTIEITATLSAPVRGSLSFPIGIGGTSRTLYVNNSAPSRNFVFSYTVQSGDSEADGIRYWAQTLRGNVAAYLHHPGGRFLNAKVNQP